MKTLINVGLLITIAISGAAMADQYRTSNTHQSALYTSDSASSEAEAVNMANSYADSLQNMSAIELSQKLPTPHRRVDKRSLGLDSTEVEVVSQQNDDGSTDYFGQVVVKYSYEYRTSKGNRSGGASSASVSAADEESSVSTPDSGSGSTPDTDLPL